MPNRRTILRLPSYIPALNGLRGVAVLGVIAYHLAPYSGAREAGTAALSSFFRFGWVGVDLFFVLSGFLITGILFDNRKGRSWIRAFYGRRMLRIMPVYYLGLALYVAAAWFVATPADLAALFNSLPLHLVYLTNLGVSVAGSWDVAPMNTHHLWTLAVEEQFYLIWPAVVAMAVRFSSSPRRTLMWICVGVTVGSITYRLFMLPGFTHAAYTALPARMDALAIGAFVALWARSPLGVERLMAVSGGILLVGGLALVLIAIPSAGSNSYLHPLQQSIGYTLWALVFGALVIRVACLPRSWLARVLSTFPLMAVGRVSYSLYLVHFPVIWLLKETGWLSLGFVVFSISVVVVSVWLALLSWEFVEAPLLKLKTHFDYDSPRGKLATPNKVLRLNVDR